MMMMIISDNDNNNNNNIIIIIIIILIIITTITVMMNTKKSNTFVSVFFYATIPIVLSAVRNGTQDFWSQRNPFCSFSPIGVAAQRERESSERPILYGPVGGACWFSNDLPYYCACR